MATALPSDGAKTAALPVSAASRHRLIEVGVHSHRGCAGISTAAKGSRTNAPAWTNTGSLSPRILGNTVTNPTNRLCIVASGDETSDISMTLIPLVFARACTRGSCTSRVPSLLRDPVRRAEIVKARSSGATSNVNGGSRGPMISICLRNTSISMSGAASTTSPRRSIVRS